MTRKVSPIRAARSWSKWPAGRIFAVLINLLFLVAPPAAARADIAAPLARAVSGSGQDQEARLLEPGKPIEREIGGGQSHFYRLTLAAGQYLYVVAEQRGIDLVVAAFGPDGKKLVEMDSPNLSHGPEPIRLIAAVAGEYRLEVRSTNERATANRYEARVEEMRASTPQDELRVSAQAAFVEGMGLLTRQRNSTAPQAIEKFEAALQLLRSTGDRREEADTLHGLGFAHNLVGGKQKALDFYQREVTLRQALADLRGEAQTLNNIGAVYSSIGETQQALEYYRRALPLLRAVGDSQVEAITLNNIGALYRQLGDLRQAAEYFKQALPLMRAENDDKGQAHALNNLGQISAALGEEEQALDHFNRSLKISRANGDKRTEAGVLHNIGLVYDSLGETGKALDHFNRAHPMLIAAGDQYREGATLTALGRVSHSLGATEKALEHLHQALSLCRTTGNRAGEANALYHLARVEFGRGDLALARAQMADALDIIESLRGKVAGWQLRASFLATAQEYYEFGVDLLMRSHRQRPSDGHDAAALETNERAIARSLLESLSEARADIRVGVDASLLERERELERHLVTMTESQARLLSGQHTESQAADTNKRIEAIIAQYNEVQAQIRASSPRYAALTQPVPLKLKDIQRQALDDNTLLLEYALGKERSYLWAVTPASITSYELPKRAEIEAAVRLVYDSFSIGGAAPASKRGAEASRALSRMLLGPVAGQLGTRRLLIVATGALQYLPFSALPVPETERRGDRKTDRRREGEVEGKASSSSVSRSLRPSVSYKPLIADHEIVNLPSASTLAVLRRELSGRAPAAKQIAVLADPVFDRTDLRVRAVAEEAAPRNRADRVQLGSAAQESGLTRFDRLRSTRREAEEIIASNRGRESLKALDFEASRATATSERLTQFRILHFATHGLLDSQHPELSGLIFSLVDERGQPQNGILRAHEVYNMKLGADLVTLSGCQTALGKEVKGEGLLGLTRGFMYAGTPRVVASLWRVPDRATAELMKRFYHGLLVEGLSAAAALRAAQISVRKEKRWAAPYYWAAFVLQGEWK
ncbi:MAG TPA: CHAT domain-containing tetratricopeptide repeat protein [Blastocatellia bacterium]|nr:CHAT domain-containing tetratricopeptide repeat protein [Blastocatellia bacterium]